MCNDVVGSTLTSRRENCCLCKFDLRTVFRQLMASFFLFLPPPPAFFYRFRCNPHFWTLYVNSKTDRKIIIYLNTVCGVLLSWRQPPKESPCSHGESRLMSNRQQYLKRMILMMKMLLLVALAKLMVSNRLLTVNLAIIARMFDYGYCFKSACVEQQETWWFGVSLF